MHDGQVAFGRYLRKRKGGHCKTKKWGEMMDRIYSKDGSITRQSRETKKEKSRMKTRIRKKSTRKTMNWRVVISIQSTNIYKPNLRPIPLLDWVVFFFALQSVYKRALQNNKEIKRGVSE